MLRALLLAVAFSCSSAVAGEIEFGIDPLQDNALTAEIMKTVGAADSLNRHGLAALERNDFESALSFFERALDLLPGYSDARNNCGVVKFRKGDIAGAREEWQALADRDSTYAIGLFNLSLVQPHDLALDSSIALLERALRINGHFTEAMVRLGWLRLKRGEKEKALAVLEKVYSLSPKIPDVQSCYAFALMEKGDTAAAVSLCSAHMGNRESARLLGRIERCRRNFPAAVAAFTQAEKDGSDPWFLPELAEAQVDALQYAGALATLKRYFGSAVAHSADAFLLAGIAAKETGDLVASADYFEQGSRAFPGDNLLRYNLGQVYFLDGKYDRAETAWNGIADSVEDPSLAYLRAINADGRGDGPGAEAFIRHALALDDRPVFHAFLGKLLYRRGDRKGAAAEFRAELALDPEIADAQLDLALCEKSGPELVAAASVLEQRLARCAADSCADIALELSTVYYSSGAVGKAASVLASVSENYRNEELYRMLSRCYRDLHRWNDAVAALETAVGKYVTRPETDFDLAEACLQAGWYDRAIEHYSKLLEKWTDNPWRIYYQLGYAYLERNDLAQARENFELSLKNRADNVAAKGLLAYVYSREGKVQGARDLWRKTVADDPTNATLWSNIGLSFEKEGNYAEALNNYKKAAALQPHDPSLQIGMGNCYAALGGTVDALSCYKEALDSPKREIAAYNLFLIYSKKGDSAQAGDALQLLRQEAPSSPYAKRASADAALGRGDTATALALLSDLSEKEPADWLTEARIHADRGDAARAEACLGQIPKGAGLDREIASVKMILAFRQGDYRAVVQSVIASGDTSFAARYNLALAYYQLGKSGEALLLADTLARRATGADRADLCRLAGNAAFRLRQWNDALGWYLQLSGVESSNAVVLYNCAVASYNLGKFDQAFDYYSQARGLDPALRNADIERRHAAVTDTVQNTAAHVGGADSLYNAALALQNADSDAVAERLYDSVLARDSLYSMAWNNLGAIYGKRGEIDKAEAAYLKAVEKRHDIPETYANLVNLYIELEQFKKARQWLVKGEGHNPDSGLWKDLRKKIVEAENRVVGKNAGEGGQ